MMRKIRFKKSDVIFEGLSVEVNIEDNDVVINAFNLSIDHLKLVFCTHSSSICSDSFKQIEFIIYLIFFSSKTQFYRKMRASRKQKIHITELFAHVCAALEETGI